MSSLYQHNQEYIKVNLQLIYSQIFI